MGDSPLFRWFEPSSSPTRTFPEIQKIIANINPVTEVLPTYDRNIRFSLVARDNQPNGGGVGSAQVALKSNTSGINWKIGEYQTVEWDVANTNNNLVNCQKVNIKLSLNNGLTYPVTLATDVPNTGKYCIVVPNNPSVNARVRVEAADNVFFDISNAAFTIAQSGTAGFSLCPGVAQGIVCLPGEYTSEISTLGLAVFADPIMLSASGLPAGATATFSPNPVMPGNSSLMTIQFAGNFTENTFGLTIQGNSGALTGSGLQTLTIVNNNYSAFAPLTPVNGATGVNAQPTMTWVAVPDADFYEIQVATNPSFDAGVMVHSKSGINADNYQVPLLLETGKLHYWRVRPVNDCGPGAWSEVQVFVVAVLTCVTVDATDLPKNISANGTPTIESVINFPNGGTINDVNVKKIQGNHTFFKDLEVHLIGPSGTDVLLWKDKCPNNISFNFGIDDVAAAPFNCPPPNNGLAYKPASPLSAFNGQNAAGNWILRVKDNVISSGGSLAAFSLELCSNAALNPPTIITNLPLALPSGNNAAITDLLLLAQDPNNGPGELVFTLMNVPAHGELLVNGVTATPGTQFTQADVNNGVIRYYDFGLNLGADSFNFSLSDGNGGMASGTFLIQPTVGSHQPESLILIEIAPNPANSHALLSLTQALEMDARVTMFNTAGQVIGNWTMEAGTTMLKLNLNHLPSGIYLVSVETTDGKTLKKLVKR
jgi:subtilisin-like proprotein convertase family protein